MTKKDIVPEPYEHYMDHFSPLEVKVTGDFENAMRQFKSLVQKSKILSVYKQKQVYEKPSEKKKRKKREMIERMRSHHHKEHMMKTGEWDRKQKQKDEKKKIFLNKKRKEAEEFFE